MEMEQMMAHLLVKMKAETRTTQAKVDASLNEMKEEKMARLGAMIQKNQERMETNQEKTMAKLDAHHERMVARTDFQLEKMEAAMDVFEERLKKVNTTDLEASREKLKTVVEQQGIPKEEAAVKSI
jgi:uncharacterized coiled-coil protein SlyX